MIPSGVFRSLPLADDGIQQRALDIAEKTRSNPLPWNGQFSPQLVDALLRQYGTPGGTALDPFVGSGTLLAEAAVLDMHSIGAEINPAAIALAELYRFVRVEHETRARALRKVAAMLSRLLPVDLPFATYGPTYGGDLDLTTKAQLVDLWNEQSDPDIKVLIRGLIVLVDFHKPDVSRRLWTTWKRIADLVSQLPRSSRDIRILHADARKLPVPAASVDIVVTSPPYINVFNYHQRYRASMEALNWNLLKVAESEIGANRKYRGNRFLTIIQYCLDMGLMFCELARICKPDARVIFVIGRESSVRKTRVLNGEILAEVACAATGFSLVRRQERSFRNKFGATIYEDVLLFSPPASVPDRTAAIDGAYVVARLVLTELLKTVPPDQRRGLQDAYRQMHEIAPSPVFHRDRSLRHGSHELQETTL
jgi:hypothetical protein